MDQNSNRVWVGDEEVNLTEIEYRILQLLITNPKRVFSNKELYESIWDESYLYTTNNTIMVHTVSYTHLLREFLKCPLLMSCSINEVYVIAFSFYR